MSKYCICDHHTDYHKPECSYSYPQCPCKSFESKPTENITIEYEKVKIGYMMATTAFHQLGEHSSKEPDLCNIYGKTMNGFYYVGAWVTGYGFFNVLFPKETTRPLTDDEVDYWSGRQVQIAHQPPYGFNADDLRASRDITDTPKDSESDQVAVIKSNKPTKGDTNE